MKSTNKLALEPEKANFNFGVQNIVGVLKLNRLFKKVAESRNFGELYDRSGRYRGQPPRKETVIYWIGMCVACEKMQSAEGGSRQKENTACAPRHNIDQKPFQT